MDIRELLKVPKILPVLVIVPKTQNGYSEGRVLFPSGAKITFNGHGSEFNLDRIRNSGHVIFIWELPSGNYFKVGVLGSISACEEVGEDTYSLEFCGKARVSYTVIAKADDDLLTASWAFIVDAPIIAEASGSLEISNAIKFLKRKFTEFFSRAFLNQQTKPEDQLLMFESPIVRYAFEILNKLNENNIPILLSQTLDAVMNGINAFMSTYLASLNILGESRALNRLYKVNGLLAVLNSSFETDKNLAPPVSSEENQGIDDLVNVILRDEIAPVQSVTIEDDEPPSIRMLHDFLSKRVIGQDRAVRTVVRAFNLVKAGYVTEQRSLITLFFAGPTSVGKTEFARALADFIWSMEKEAIERAKQNGIQPHISEKEIEKPPLVEVDCGMFAGSLSHGVSNLVGAPTGYVGSKGTKDRGMYQEPILTPKNFPPNRITVLLFDEIEKAFVDSRDNGAEIMGVLMKILDKGEFVNNDCDIVDFRRTIVIFTSNIGSKDILNAVNDVGIGFTSSPKKEWLTEQEVEEVNYKIYNITKKAYEKLFPPEFRNRIHRLVVFHFLHESHYREIINKEFSSVRDWGKKRGIEISLSDEAVEWILAEINAEEGVRKLRDFMANKIMEPIAKAYNLRKLTSAKRVIVNKEDFSIE